MIRSLPTGKKVTDEIFGGKVPFLPVITVNESCSRLTCYQRSLTSEENERNIKYNSHE